MKTVNLGICEKSDRKIVRLASDDYREIWAMVALTEEQCKLLEYLIEEFNLEEYISVDFDPTATEI